MLAPAFPFAKRSWKVGHILKAISSSLQPGFLSGNEQRSLTVSCLRDQSRHPNETNLDAHYKIPDSGIWELWEQHWRSKNAAPSPTNSQIDDSFDDAPIHPKASPHSALPPQSQSIAVPPSEKRSLISNIPATLALLPTLLSTPKPPPSPSSKISPTPVSKLIYKLRWANIGRSYHWGTKNYDFETTLAKVSEDVRGFCKSAVKSVKWEDVWGDGVGTEDSEDVGTIEEEEWGDEGVNWQSWKEDYGMSC